MQTIKFESKKEWLELRAKDLTSTDVATLFDVNPYSTYFELWHTKKSKEIVTIEENERMHFGNVLEPIIAKEVCDKLNVKGEPFKIYGRIPELRLGSSFDWIINNETLLEIKNVDGLVFYKKWGKNKDGNDVAPLHIELQVQYQMLITGFEKAYIGALVGGNNLVILERERNESIMEEIKSRAAKFWKSIDDNQEPEPNFETDYNYLFKMFNFADPEKVLELDGQGPIWKLAVRYNEAKQIEKSTKTEINSLKAEMLTLITDNGVVKHDDFKITAKVNKNGSRSFRLTWKGE